MRRTPGGGRQDWRTPKALFDKLEETFGKFDLDWFADDENHLCPDYFTEKNSAYNVPLVGRGVSRGFANPPFSDMLNAIELLRRMADTEGITSFMLAPADFGIKKWGPYAWTQANGIIFLTPRVAYDPPPGVKKSSPTGSSMALVFSPEPRGENPEVMLLEWR